LVLEGSFTIPPISGFLVAQSIIQNNDTLYLSYTNGSIYSINYTVSTGIINFTFEQTIPTIDPYNLIQYSDCLYTDLGEISPVGPPPPISNVTEINIWFDNSGSMNSTLAPLEDMRDNLLRDCLIQLYNNDDTLYNLRVKVFKMGDEGYNERGIFCLGAQRNFGRAADLSVNSVINLVFQDEAQTAYHSALSTFSPTANRTLTYDTDMNAFRTTLNNLQNGGYYRGVVFRVNTGPNTYEGFKQFLIAVRDGLGNYSGPNGLSDKTEVKFITDVVDGSTAQYYTNQIITALNTLGYNLQSC
jgi:hypothetical protein